MATTYNSRHIEAKPVMDNPGLKPWPVSEQDIQDAEVFAMVNDNPQRKVDANALPPIVMGNDGRLFFMDTTPSPWETFGALLTIIAMACGALAAILGAGSLIICLAAEIPVPVGIMKGCLFGFAVAAFTLSMNGGSHNGKKKNR